MKKGLGVPLHLGSHPKVAWAIIGFLSQVNEIQHVVDLQTSIRWSFIRFGLSTSSRGTVSDFNHLNQS